jgi:hypothetical protein
MNLKRLYSVFILITISVATLTLTHFTWQIVSAEDSKNVTFYTIIFSNPQAGNKAFEISKTTLNGTIDEQKSQLNTLVDEVYNMTYLKVKGPHVFYGTNANETIVLDNFGKKESMKYYEELLNDPSRAREQCWIFWLGGGSAHGDCPPATAKTIK